MWVVSEDTRLVWFIVCKQDEQLRVTGSFAARQCQIAIIHFQYIVW